MRKKPLLSSRQTPIKIVGRFPYNPDPDDSPSLDSGTWAAIRIQHDERIFLLGTGVFPRSPDITSGSPDAGGPCESRRQHHLPKTVASNGASGVYTRSTRSALVQVRRAGRVLSFLLHSAPPAMRRGCSRPLQLLGPSSLFFVAILLFPACSGSGASRDEVRLQGKASYYADKFNGRTTANGETYDPQAMTAAHRTLPFDTIVRVTRTDVPHEPSVVVRINDRVPFVDGRIIDLSKVAARKLDMIVQGTVPVRLEIVESTSGSGP